MSKSISTTRLVGLVAVVLVIVFGLSATITALKAPDSSHSKAGSTVSVLPKSSQEPESLDVALEQCRIAAIVNYVEEVKGLKPGDYVIGEENLDKTLPGFIRAGENSYNRGGQVAETRDQLAAVFASDDPAMVKVVEAEVRKFQDQFPREQVLNVENREVVQYLIPSIVEGNTGLDDNGNQVSSGDTESDVGDAEWLFIDTDGCVVPTANFDSMGEPVDPSTPEDQKPVGSIRVACLNPNDGLTPKKPEESTARNPAVPDWIKDEPTGGNHSVNNNDGATDPRGLQVNPEADANKAAEDAAKAAEKEQLEKEQAEEEAKETGGGVVDTNQENTPVSPPPPSW